MNAKAFSSSIATFSARFLKELETGKSVISSPLSTELVLALLALGASGTARDELLAAIGVPDDAAIRSSFSELSSKLRSIKGATLRVANKVYVKEGRYELQPALKRDAADVFDAGVDTLDFDDSVGAANTVNKWVEEKTNNKIKDMTSPSQFNNDTRMILLNAIYFKGSWSKIFREKDTKELPFHINVTTTVDKPMMYRYDYYDYCDNSVLQAQILKMTYLGDETSMVFVLPHQVDGLNDVLKKLANGHDLVADLSALRNSKVHVTIPKFKIETEINLKEVLTKLGIKDIFKSSTTGLNKMLTNQESIYVSDAIQKAFIEVNEEGAEAAVCMSLYMVNCSARPKPPPIRFTADRPFLYLLIGPDSTVLFLGVYCG